MQDIWDSVECRTKTLFNENEKSLPSRIDRTCRACGSGRTNAIAADDGAHYRSRNCRVIKIYSRDMATRALHYDGRVIRDTYDNDGGARATGAQRAH